MTSVPLPSTGPPRLTFLRVFEHEFLSYRKTFRASVFSSFLLPVLFLTAMGLGLGSYVQGGSLGGVSYLAFIAPGLLASSAMQTGAFESTFPIIAGLQWSRVFHAMAATPISGRDVALGTLAWIGARLLLTSTVFTVVIVLFGAAGSPLVVFGILTATLTGLAFAAPIAAFSATQRTVEKFNAIFRFGITPLFLFSGTFFPVEQLPAGLQFVAWLTPLYHGVWLTRALSLGVIADAPGLALVHLMFLLAWIGVGTAWVVRTISARLVRG